MGPATGVAGCAFRQQPEQGGLFLRVESGEEAGGEAASGVRYVLHTASPMPFDPTAELITTAREGTRRVLGAAALPTFMRGPTPGASERPGGGFGLSA